MLFRRKPAPPAPIVHAGDDDLERIVAEHPGVVLVDFWAPWCGPCRMTGPILDEIAREFEPEGVLVVKVDVDHAPESATGYDVRSIPTLIFFRAGEPEFEMVGPVPKPVLEREIRTLLQARPGPGM